MDTPAFSDNSSLDVEIFEELAVLLRKMRIERIKLGGILYLHRIPETQITSSAVRAFRILKAMCGLEGAKNVTLVTTMWDGFKADSHEEWKANNREDRLKMLGQYWGWAYIQGSRHRRWSGTRLSALSIVEDTLENCERAENPVLEIQRELADNGADLDDTLAGREMLKQHITEMKRLKRGIRTFRNLERACEEDDMERLRWLRAEHEDLERQHETVAKAERRLRDNFESVISDKTEQLQDMFEKRSEEIQELTTRIEFLQKEISAIGQHIPTTSPATAAVADQLAQRPTDQKVQQQQLESELARAKAIRLSRRNTLAMLNVIGARVSFLPSRTPHRGWSS